MTAKRAAARQGSREGDGEASDHPLMAMRESRNEPQTVADAGPLSVRRTGAPSSTSASNWLFLSLRPPIVLGAEEIRKRFIRRRP